jgi:hypothetical protein
MRMLWFDWTKQKINVRRLEKESDKGVLCHRFCVKVCSEYLTEKVFRTFKCVDGLVLLAKEETAVKGVNDRLNEIGRC